MIDLDSDFWRGKAVLVTGGAGFIGSNLVDRLVRSGARVRATIHDKEPLEPNPGAEYVECDLRLPEDCRRVCRDIDYVFACAAVTSGAGVIDSTPLVHLTPNVIMNTNLLDAAKTEGVQKLLFISSSIVYPVTDHPVREEDAGQEFFEKYFIAGWMKRFTEIMCEMYASKIDPPLSTVIVRPGNAYGPGDDFEWETSHVLPAMIRRVVERHDPIEVWGDGEDIKDFIYIDDLVEGMLKAMARADVFGMYNIASGRPHRLRDILETIIRLDGYHNAEVRYDASRPSMIRKRLISVDKAETQLGFKAETSIEDGLAQTIAWYRKVAG